MSHFHMFTIHNCMIDLHTACGCTACAFSIWKEKQRILTNSIQITSIVGMLILISLLKSVIIIYSYCRE